MPKKNTFILLTFLLFLFSCDSNPWKVDLNEVDLELDWKRFDLALYKNSHGDFNASSWNDLLEEFPNLLPLYVEKVMQFGPINDPASKNTLKQFLSNEDIKGLLRDVAEKYKEGSLDKQQKEITNAFKRYHYHFAENEIPVVRTLVSAFTYSTVAAEGLLGLCIEMYMGADYELYPRIGIPQYKFKNYDIEYLPSDAIKGWLTSEFEKNIGKNLLERMIFNGKIIYLTKAFLPNSKDYYAFNYDAEDLEWCEKNEVDIWYHFIDAELFYTNDAKKIKKYMGDAPFITGFPEGSPGRVGEWIGYKIVESYMKNNEQLSLKDLMNEENADKILQQSRYKPKR